MDLSTHSAAYDRIAGRITQPIDALVDNRLEIVMVHALEQRRIS